MMRPAWRFALAAGLLAGCAADARAQAGLLVPTRTGRPDAAVLSLREMTVDVGIARGYARVSARQIFENHTDQPQEGTYRFALPPSAAVGDFAVWDGLVRIPGVILEKQRARSIYRQLTTQRIDPGLLQQGEEEDREPGHGPAASRPSGGALFSVTVAPIPARGTKRLEILFQQEVPFALGEGEFRLGLRPQGGEPAVAGHLEVHVHIGDRDGGAGAGALPLTGTGRALDFAGTAVRLDRDIVVRLGSQGTAPLALSTFRNPEGHLPDGLALAPWERPSEIPPEKDGFFLLEAFPPAATAPASVAAAPKARPPISLAILFDTSLSHRWAGLETSYARLLRVVDSLRPEDRFVLVPFDREPSPTSPTLQPATRDALDAALHALRQRPLAPGTDVPRAVAAGRRLAGDAGRIILFADGQGTGSSNDLAEARASLPLFAAISGEVGESLQTAATSVLGASSTDVESDLFVKRTLAPIEEKPSVRAPATAIPFTVTGGEPRLRDVYPVMIQPPAPGSLSGFVGRYALPQEHLRWNWPSPLFAGGSTLLEAPLPERATEARDLPRRWARARVDDLLRRIEAEGERREWIEEIIALSKRYKFVTPYTAFLAAPRSLLRPRRIQPGDPVLRVECDAGTVAAVAFFPFGLRLPLERRSGTHLWEGRFLVPEGLADGRYTVRIVLRDASRAAVAESKSFVLDGRAPVVTPDAFLPAHGGETMRVAVRTDEDVLFVSARLGDSPPVSLRWDAALKRSVGLLRVPVGLHGAQEVFFEAVDSAKNHGFARATLSVLP